MNGMELMLKSLGLGDAMKGVDQLMKAGAIEKVMRFADEAEQINRRLERIESELSLLIVEIRQRLNNNDR